MRKPVKLILDMHDVISNSNKLSCDNQLCSRMNLCVGRVILQ